MAAKSTSGAHKFVTTREIESKPVVSLRLCGLRNASGRCGVVRHFGTLRDLYTLLYPSLRLRAPLVNEAVEALTYETIDSQGAVEYVAVEPGAAWVLLLPGVRLLCVPGSAYFFPYDKGCAQAHRSLNGTEDASALPPIFIGYKTIQEEQAANPSLGFLQRPDRMGALVLEDGEQLPAPLEIQALEMAQVACREYLIRLLVDASVWDLRDLRAKLEAADTGGPDGEMAQETLLADALAAVSNVEKLAKEIEEEVNPACFKDDSDGDGKEDDEVEVEEDGVTRRPPWRRSLSKMVVSTKWQSNGYTGLLPLHEALAMAEADKAPDHAVPVTPRGPSMPGSVPYSRTVTESSLKAGKHLHFDEQGRPAGRTATSQLSEEERVWRDAVVDQLAMTFSSLRREVSRIERIAQDRKTDIERWRADFTAHKERLQRQTLVNEVKISAVSLGFGVVGACGGLMGMNNYGVGEASYDLEQFTWVIIIFVCFGLLFAIGTWMLLTPHKDRWAWAKHLSHAARHGSFKGKGKGGHGPQPQVSMWHIMFSDKASTEGAGTGVGSSPGKGSSAGSSAGRAQVQDDSNSDTWSPASPSPTGSAATEGAAAAGGDGALRTNPMHAAKAQAGAAAPPTAGGASAMPPPPPPISSPGSGSAVGAPTSLQVHA